jgi:hypothetical protein
VDSELGGGRVRRRRARDCGFLPERISLKCEILSVKARMKGDGAPSWRSSGRPITGTTRGCPLPSHELRAPGQALVRAAPRDRRGRLRELARAQEQGRRLIAEVAPLPSWCVDVLLSPDLLPQLFSSLRSSEHAAAGVCTTWSHAYSRQLRRCCYVNPRSVRQLAGVPKQPAGLCMLPGGVLAIASCDPYNNQKAVQFVAARNDTDPQALAACRASGVAARRFQGISGLALTNDGLLVCSYNNPLVALYKYAKDGSKAMSPLATVPPLAGYDFGFKRCAVHQQTQRTYAIGENLAGHHALVVLDTNLHVVATVDVDDVAGDEPIRDVAVHGDQVIVLATDSHAEGSGLRLLDLDGRFLRTIAAGQFINPQAVTVLHGRAFVIDDGEDDGDDDDDDESGKVLIDVLHVIDIQSGDILQSARFDLGGCFAILVDGDDVYISSCTSNKVVVLQLAGSEA